MKRRQVLFAIAGIVMAFPAPESSAQKPAPPFQRVVFVDYGDENSSLPLLQRFQQGMQEAGQADGRTYSLEMRHANGNVTLVPGMIRDAVASLPAVVVVIGLSAARHARDATSTVPVVVVTASNLVDAGIVKSYAHPGGNITGLCDLADDLAIKRLELLKEALPKATRVALLVDPDFPATPKIESRVRLAGRKLGVEISRLDATDLDSLMLALDSLKKSRHDALLVGGSALHVQRAKELIQRAGDLSVPVVHYWPGTAEMGALISHQADVSYNFRRAAYYVDRILKGAKPAELPIEQPTRYEIVVNKKTAKELALTFPPSILLRADRVIE